MNPLSAPEQTRLEIGQDRPGLLASLLQFLKKTTD